jgi:hypothetical protein
MDAVRATGSRVFRQRTVVNAIQPQMPNMQHQAIEPGDNSSSSLASLASSRVWALDSLLTKTRAPMP